MNSTGKIPVAKLKIPPELKSRPVRQTYLVYVGIAAVFILLLLVYFFAAPAKLTGRGAGFSGQAADPVASKGTTAGATVPARSGTESGDVILTATGYIIPRERIQLGPKLGGTVAWIGVRRGDRVQKGQVIVRLEDAEYRARLLEAQGKLTLAEAELKSAASAYQRQLALHRNRVGTDQALDDAVRAVDVAKAQVLIGQGQLALAETWLQWCQIESPVDGIVLAKYVNAGELVIPQAYSGSGHPSTLLVALADLHDLQVETDLNELDTPKVRLNQPCRVRPEAYKDKIYDGHVAEISPEADRSKGTLEIKVKINNPDGFLVPELNARVEFLAVKDAPARPGRD